jgi:fumarate reductase flavoprotein subunit
VFGGIAGDTIARWIGANAGHRAPDEAVLEAEAARAIEPFARRGGDINRLRERLLDTMWEHAGVIRDRAGLERALADLDDIEAELLATGLPDQSRTFNLTWHDWLNLRSLIETSRVIALAAQARENSRGAHFREDFPDPGELAASTFTVARQRPEGIDVTAQPVRFTIVRPGETLLKDRAAAE